MFWVRLARILSHHTALAIEPRGGRVGGGPAMLVRPVGHDHPRPWNKGLLVGQKKPLQPKHVWSIRVRLEIALTWRDLALFNWDRQQASRIRFGQTSVQRSGTERQSFKKRRADRCNSRLRSRRGPPSKFGCGCSGQLALDISSRADFMHALTYPPGNTPG